MVRSDIKFEKEFHQRDSREKIRSAHRRFAWWQSDGHVSSCAGRDSNAFHFRQVHSLFDHRFNGVSLSSSSMRLFNALSHHRFHLKGDRDAPSTGAGFSPAFWWLMVATFTAVFKPVRSFCG
jgi:hypothetical protein